MLFFNHKNSFFWVHLDSNLNFSEYAVDTQTNIVKITDIYKGKETITKDNINEIISANIPDKEIDLLSVDIDGNDVHVFNEISVINPRVVVIEYNAKFPPPIMFSVDYNPAHMWKGDDYMGASLEYIEKNLDAKGYNLVGCDLSGSNAFFVREDLVTDKFLAPYTAERHYQPARYYLVGGFVGHRATYSSVEKVLSSCIKINN